MPFATLTLDFTTPSLTIGSTNVPAGSLIAFNGDSARIQALNKDTGEQIVGVPVPTPLQGGFVMPVTGTLFGVDWSSDSIAELDPSVGHVAGSFSVSPPGSPVFGIYFGDADYCPSGDMILVAGTNFSVVRYLSTTGSWLGDVDLSDLGVPSRHEHEAGADLARGLQRERRGVLASVQAGGRRVAGSVAPGEVGCEVIGLGRKEA